MTVILMVGGGSQILTTTSRLPSMDSCEVVAEVLLKEQGQSVVRAFGDAVESITYRCLAGYKIRTDENGVEVEVPEDVIFRMQLPKKTPVT